MFFPDGQSLTRTATRTIIGSLEPGKDADIAIFDGNLFDSMSLCRLVMIDGEIYKNTL